MVRELGRVRDRSKNSVVAGVGNLQKEGGFASNSHEKQRRGVNNVNKFIGDIAKKYMGTTEGETWASDLIDHLSSRFPTPIKAPKDSVRRKIWDANLRQLASSHSSLPELTLPCFRNPDTLQPPENRTNAEYSCGYRRGSAYGRNVASTTTSPEQASSVTECSYGGVTSDTEAFANRTDLPGSSAENSFKTRSFKRSADDMDEVRSPNSDSHSESRKRKTEPSEGSPHRDSNTTEPVTDIGPRKCLKTEGSTTVRDGFSQEPNQHGPEGSTVNRSATVDAMADGDRKEIDDVSGTGPKSGESVAQENRRFDSVPDVSGSRFEPVEPTVAGVSSVDRGGPEKITTQSASLADFFTTDQLKEHISSFTPKKGVSGTPTHPLGQNTCQLCKIDKLVFAPAPMYCSSCTARIKRNVGYYRTADESGPRLCFCMSCYRGSHKTSIAAHGFSVPKSGLQKARNDEEREDSWVQCDRCQGWQHRICGLYNDERDAERKERYVCPKCLLEEIESGKRVPLPKTAVFGARDLARTNLGDHIERRLAKRLEFEREEMARICGVKPEEVPGPEDLVVRVVVSVEKKLDVKPKFIDILHGQDYPRDFTYTSKLIFLFQNIQGVDVCLFGMCVQEFGPDCLGPNHRCVYISYLDSVKYFRPDRKSVNGESLRTFVYHEILIGYLEYCKMRGFATCYVWACPVIKGEDYVFYCHPATQKTPKQDKLRLWYKSMLKKAFEDGIVVDHTNLYNEFFVPTGEGGNKITAARLPYFDGDYWSGAAENIVRKLEEEESGGGSLQSKLPTKRMLKAMGQDNLDVATKDVLVMQKLGQTILPVKENFMIVRLHYVCTDCHGVISSGSKWSCDRCKRIQLCSRCFDEDGRRPGSRTHTCHTGEKNPLSEVVVNDVTLDSEEKDGVVVNGLFETRDAFLNKCQKSLFQFDTLGRAKYSSMMILYHLTRKPVCAVCRKDVVLIEQGPARYVCGPCYETKGGKSNPPPTKADNGPESEEARKEIRRKIRALLETLIHASRCPNIPCPYPRCGNLRRLFYHASRCDVRAAGGCRCCRHAWGILKLHSRICRDSDCGIPRCTDIKKHVETLAALTNNTQ